MNTTELYRIIEQKERHINYLEAQNKELIVKNMDLQEQLTIPVVVESACNDYVEGINMQCASCDQPKYKH